MNSALIQLVKDINDQEARNDLEPIVITEKVLKEITNGMVTRAFCTTFGVSVKRVSPRGTQEYLELTPKVETNPYEDSSL